MIGIPKGTLELLVVKYIRWLHGGGALNQYLFYRCRYCQRIVTHRAIAQGGCKCGNNEVIPAALTFRDKFKILFLPWLIQH